ncbi:hypothetical protein [Mycobacterium antarcticum]|nr:MULTISPECIES: hypothetical protein [unclassified Mycolicibacterium]
MNIHPQRLGSPSGILLTLFWAPMAIVLRRIPDLHSVAEVESFWGV